MASVNRTIGLSLGADICWPICYEEIVKRLALAIPWQGDTVGIDVERVTIEPFDLHQPRVDQKGRDHGRPLRVQQSMVGAVEREADDLLRDDAPGHADPGHLADS